MGSTVYLIEIAAGQLTKLLFELRSQLRVINKSADELSAKLQTVNFTNFWRSGKIYLAVSRFVEEKNMSEFLDFLRHQFAYVAIG